MKHIYFIRHGETEGNKKRIHQPADEPLTQKGRLQAHHVAHLLSPYKIDRLISSSFLRARETAAIIGQNLALPPSLETCLVEVHRPAHLYGTSYSSLGTIVYFMKLFLNRETPEWDYAGAENMFALRNRIEDAKRFLTETEGERVAVVTHDVFMNLFLVHACQEKKLSLKEYLRVIALTKKTPNTGIIHVTFDAHAPKGVCSWQFVESIDPKVVSST